MYPLTPRQTDIALLLAVTGASNQELGRSLGISIHTVKVLLDQIYTRLGFKYTGINPRIGLILWVWRGGHDRCSMV